MWKTIQVFITPFYISNAEICYYKNIIKKLQCANITSMKNNYKLRYCVILNLILFLIILFVVMICKDNNNYYMTYGPNENLYVLSIKINTPQKYIFLQFFLLFVEFSRVFTNEIASPILGFNIYNPDKKIITEFTKNELQLLANMMWLINSLTGAIFVMITISQIDIAILRTVYSEMTTIITIRMLLNEKKFICENNVEPIELEQLNV